MSEPPTKKHKPNGASSSSSSPPQEKVAASFAYQPYHRLPNISGLVGQLVEIVIPNKQISWKNPAVLRRQLWGDCTYTDDSDAVCILQHAGLLSVPSVPKSSGSGQHDGVRIQFRVKAATSQYPGTHRFLIKSRPWASLYDQGMSVEACGVRRVSKAQLAEMEQKGALRAMVDAGPVPTGRVGNLPLAHCHRLRPNKFVPDHVIVFDLDNRPCLRYCVALLVDRGSNSDDWTSAKLRSQTLIFEGQQELDGERPSGPVTKYQLSFDAVATKNNANGQSRYRWSQCPTGVEIIQAPATAVLSDLDWDELEWSEAGVCIRDQHRFRLTNLRWLPSATSTEEQGVGGKAEA